MFKYLSQIIFIALATFANSSPIYFDKSEAIMDSDDRLVIRKQQLESFKKK